jgi:hypothetical protein
MVLRERRPRYVLLCDGWHQDITPGIGKRAGTSGIDANNLRGLEERVEGKVSRGLS